MITVSYMSTKNIARSALEGGRSNTWERRHSSSEERSTTRQWLRHAEDEGLASLVGQRGLDSVRMVIRVSV